MNSLNGTKWHLPGFIVITMLVSISTIAQISFLPYQTVSINGRAEVVAIGDINNDGLDDVVAGISLSSNPNNQFHIFVFTQDTSGGLNPPVKYPYSTNKRITSITISDVNEDNLNDVIVGHGNYIGIFYQNPNGTLNTIQNLYSGNTVDGVKCGDLSGNGRKDIAVSHWNDDHIRVFYRSFSSFTGVNYDKPDGGYDEIDVGDVNGDGKDDVVFMAGQAYGGIHVYIQNNSSLNPYTSYFLQPQLASSFLSGIAIGDVNNDGLNDVVATKSRNIPEGKVIVWLQDSATGLLQTPPIYLPTLDVPEPVEITDLNCDGLNEIIVAHGGWNSVSVYKQQNGEIDSNYLAFGLPYASAYHAQGMAIGDLNADGKPDVALADYNVGLVLLKNNSNVPPTFSDTLSMSVIIDTTYSNIATHSNYLVDTSMSYFNNYQIVRIDSILVTTTTRSDSIRVDSIFMLDQIICGVEQIDTTFKSGWVYHERILTSDTSNLSSTNDTTNQVTKIVVYPNPTNALVTIELPSPFDEPGLSISLFDSNGRLLFMKKFEDKRNKRQLSLAFLASGEYLMVFSKHGRKLEQQKVIKLE